MQGRIKPQKSLLHRLFIPPCRLLPLYLGLCQLLGPDTLTLGFLPLALGILLYRSLLLFGSLSCCLSLPVLFLPALFFSQTSLLLTLTSLFFPLPRCFFPLPCCFLSLPYRLRLSAGYLGYTYSPFLRDVPDTEIEDLPTYDDPITSLIVCPRAFREFVIGHQRALSPPLTRVQRELVGPGHLADPVITRILTLEPDFERVCIVALDDPVHAAEIAQRHIFLDEDAYLMVSVVMVDHHVGFARSVRHSRRRRA